MDDERVNVPLISDVFDTSAVGVLVIDSHFNIASVNRSLERYFGLPGEKLIRKNARQVVRRRIKDIFEDPESFAAKVLSAYDNNDYVEHFECHVLPGPEREERWLEHYSQPIRSGPYAGGRIEHYADVTGEKLAARQRRALMRLYRNTVATIPSPLLALDAELNVMLANRRFLEERRVAAREVVGKNITEILPASLLSEQSLLERIRAVARTGGDDELLGLKHATGDHSETYLNIRICNIPPEEEGEKEPRVLLVMDDVTRQRSLEARVRNSQKMEAIVQLAGSLAHDFNNLLTTILGYTDLIRGSLGEDSPLRGDAEEIYKAGEHGVTLAEQLLTFSRPQVPSARTLDLNEVIAGVEKLLRRLVREDVELVVTPATDLGCVRVDPGQIEQILVNLVLNARDAMPGGGKLTIETANAALDAQRGGSLQGAPHGRYVRLAVSDTGCGMDEEVRSRIFEPFFTTKRASQGAGLGLSMVYGFVRQSDGRIYCYSEPGRGTTFMVYLPTVEGPAEPMSLLEADRALGGAETILLVEDEDAVRDVAGGVLERMGYTVLEARNADEALSACRGHGGPVHLLLADVVMPQMNGRELARELAKERPGIRTLYISGYTQNAILRKGLLDSGADFLSKPFACRDLALKVRRVLDG